MAAVRIISRVLSVRREAGSVRVRLRDQFERELEIQLGPRQVRTLAGKLLEAMRRDSTKPPKRADGPRLLAATRPFSSRSLSRAVATCLGWLVDSGFRTAACGTG
jgi:hypothetical protein